MILLIALSLCQALLCSGRALQSLPFNTIPSETYREVQTDPSGVVWPWLAFKSSPQTPPNMTITGNGGELAEGYIFMTPVGTSENVSYAKENAGFIMTSGGDLVFGLNVSGLTDFRRQLYNGHAYLTYWSGYNTQGVNTGHGYGQVNFLDDTYKNFSINPNLGLNKLTTTENPDWSIDIHEQQLTSRNTLLVSAYNNTQADLTAYGGPADGWVVEAVVFSSTSVRRKCCLVGSR